MFLLPFLKSKSIVGLDIHSDEIRLLQLRRSAKKDLCVQKLAISELPPGVILDGRIKASHVVKNTIKNLIQTTETHGHPVAIALPSSHIIIKRIALTMQLTEKECVTEMMRHLEPYSTGRSEELCIDFINYPDKLNKKEVLLCAVPQEVLSEYVNVVNQAGLNVKIVDVDSYASARAAMLSSSPTQKVAIFTINQADVQFIVFQQFDILFSHQWVISNQEPFMPQLIQQVELTMQLFASVCSVALDLLILSGKMAFPDLALKIEKVIGITTVCANPFSKMTTSSFITNRETLSLIAPRFLVSYGLSLRGVM